MSKKGAAPQLDGFAPGARPICGFCNAPWTDDMVELLHKCSLELGYYGDVEAIDIDSRINIICEACKRLIYSKEVSRRNDGSAWSNFH